LQAHWLGHLHQVTRPALLAATRTFLTDIKAACLTNGLQDAVARRDSKPIYDQLIRGFQYQGISDAAADGFTRKHGGVSWDQIAEELQHKDVCPLLRSYWSFSGCKYLKSAKTCSHPADMPTCIVPRLPLRKGILSQSAVSLFLFIRDICGGDIVGWIDDQLAAADDRSGSLIERASAMRIALLDPLKGVHGVSDKVLGMALADLLLGSDQCRQRWIITGASMIAIDTLVHNFLHRTGVLRRAGAEHPYGPQCYSAAGCADIIAAFAVAIDAREINSDFPEYFPRFLQHAIWRFCAQGIMDVCNGNKIEDENRCCDSHCANFEVCDRLPLRK
jgi:hypothetical protein